jgi:hypothetical protein
MIKIFIKLFVANIIMKNSKRISICEGIDSRKNDTDYPNSFINMQKQKLLFYLEDEKIATFNKIDEIYKHINQYNTLNIENGQLYKDWNFTHF